MPADVFRTVSCVADCDRLLKAWVASAAPEKAPSPFPFATFVQAPLLKAKAGWPARLGQNAVWAWAGSGARAMPQHASSPRKIALTIDI
jgi:hypothetical protein